MTEFQEIVKDAPKFASMEHGELVAHAYAMYASGAKMDTENDKLRELVRDMYKRFHGVVIENWSYSSEDFYMYEQRMRELGVEVN